MKVKNLSEVEGDPVFIMEDMQYSIENTNAREVYKIREQY